MGLKTIWATVHNKWVSHDPPDKMIFRHCDEPPQPYVLMADVVTELEFIKAGLLNIHGPGIADAGRKSKGLADYIDNTLNKLNQPKGKTSDRRD